MTGLFHRLARQIVGPEPPRARTAARLPFAGLRMPEEQSVERPREVPPRAPGRVPGRETADRGPEAASRGDGPGGEAATAPAAPRLLPQVHLPMQPRSAEPDAREGTRSGPEVQPAVPAPVESSTPRAGPPDDPPEPALADAPSEAAAPEAPARRTPATETPRHHPGPREAGPAAAPHLPQPLMPEAATPATTQEPAPGATARRREAAATEPHEVHVHIGRIDVASVSAPPQRPDPPRRRAGPRMSLEDYLARRKSGGS